MFHFPFFLGGLACYFLPTIVGAARHKTNLVGIFLVNFLLGWSIVGWVVALVWALSTERNDPVRGPQTWAPQPQQQQRTLYCPHCGAGGPPGGRFCAHCGAALP